MDAGGDAGAATGEDAHADAAGASADAAAPAAEAAAPRFARNQPTSAELRVAAGISTDLHAAIRAGAGSTTTGGRDAGASSDGGSRSASSSAAQASHAAPAAPDMKAAVDAVQMATRAAGSISAELATAPQLQNVVRGSGLEAAAASALDRDGASVSAQVLESIRLQWAKGGGDAQMTLQPGYLGGLSVSLRVDKDVVTASVVAESPAVREWLRANEFAAPGSGLTSGCASENSQWYPMSHRSRLRATPARGDRPSGRDRQAASRQQYRDLVDPIRPSKSSPSKERSSCPRQPQSRLRPKAPSSQETEVQEDARHRPRGDRGGRRRRGLRDAASHGRSHRANPRGIVELRSVRRSIWPIPAGCGSSA